jgi:hypothetical protein
MSTHAVFPGAWIFMLLLILVVFGIIVAIVRRSWLVGGIVLFVVLLIAGFMFSVRSYDSVRAPATAVIVSEAGSKPIAWEPSPDELKNADVFSTRDDAAKALANRILDRLDGRPKSSPITRIHITESRHFVAEEVKEVFKTAYPSAEITVSATSPTDRSALRITIQNHGDDRNRQLMLTAQLSDFAESVSARIEPKVWVHNPTQFMNDNPRRQWLIGWSQQPEYSYDGARRAARRDAIRQMLPLVRTALPRPGSAHRHDDAWLSDLLDREIQMGRFKKEEFVQRMNLPVSGQQVYRAGILVDASSSQVRGVQESLQREYRYHANRSRNIVFTVVGLSALICFLYLFLNWSTRG